MAQSESNNVTKIEPPSRKFTVELLVGLFTLVGVVAAGILAVGLGGQTIFGTGQTVILAEFDNISGLEKGASVEIAGVPIGEVSDIHLKDPVAVVSLRLNSGIQIRDDDIASIRTKGIIGDRYVKVSRGGSTEMLNDGDRMTETESVVDTEDIIGKIVHSITGEKDDKKDEKKAE